MQAILAMNIKLDNLGRAKLDDFLKLGDHPLLDGAGRVSAKQAQRHVDSEYDRWHTRAINAPSAVEQHFIEATAKVKKVAASKKDRLQ